MRRIPRVNRSIDLLQFQATRVPPSTICLACRFQATSFSTSSPRAAPKTKNAKKLAFTDRLRNRIWGTQEPPGDKDPYGDASVFDRTKKGGTAQFEEDPAEVETAAEKAARRKERREKNKKDPNYVPAETWDGLEIVGEKFNARVTPGNEFEAFAPTEIADDAATLMAELHRAVVEVFTLKQAGKPLSLFSNRRGTSVLDWTHDVKITPTEDGATLEYGQHGSAEDIIKELETPSESMQEVAEAKADETEHRAESEQTVDGLQPIAHEHSELVMTVDDLVSSFDTAFLKVPLKDLDVRFAVSLLFQRCAPKHTNNFRSSRESSN